MRKREPPAKNQVRGAQHMLYSFWIILEPSVETSQRLSKEWSWPQSNCLSTYSALEPSGEIANSLISLSSYRSSRAKNVHTNFLTVLRLVLSELPG